MDDLNKTILEICCGSYEDAIIAQENGADRIELNSALYLGGLTPSTASLKMCKEKLCIPIIAMVRPRGAGFLYSDLEYEQMKNEAIDLLENKADGIVFGFLNEDSTINVERTKEFVELAHSYNALAVFSRAIDLTFNFESSLDILSENNVDRVLTSCCNEKVCDDLEHVNYIVDKYHDKIDILLGGGINNDNIDLLLENRNIYSIHSSCRSRLLDPTTSGPIVDFSYTGHDLKEYVDSEKVLQLRERIDQN